MSDQESMSFTEAKAIFVQQIRKQTATGLLIAALDKVEEAQYRVAELETQKVALLKEIADIEPRRAAGIAEAKEAAAKEGRKLAATYAAHEAQARGQVEQLQAEMRKYVEAQQVERAEIERLKREVISTQEVLETWQHRIQEAQERLREVQQQHERQVKETQQFIRAQETLRAQWEAEHLAAQDKVKAVKRELASVVAQFQTEAEA